MSRPNKVEIVKLISALRARDLPALFYLYKSETTDMHQIAWLPKTVIAIVGREAFYEKYEWNIRTNWRTRCNFGTDLYQSKTNEVHQFAWLPETVIVLLVNSIFRE